MRLKVPSAWRAAWRRSAFEDGMDAEMRFHLESRAADLIARGMAPDDARRMGGIVINVSKAEPLTYGEKDRIIVLARD